MELLSIVLTRAGDTDPGKSRLAPQLSMDDRRRLAHAMLLDVVERIVAAHPPASGNIALAGPAAEMARENLRASFDGNITALTDGDWSDLSSTLASCTRIRRPGQSLMIIPADVPEIPVSTLAGIIHSVSVPNSIVAHVGPAHDGGWWCCALGGGVASPRRWGRLGTSHAGSDLIATLRDSGARVELAEPHSDIDSPDDLIAMAGRWRRTDLSSDLPPQATLEVINSLP